MANLASEYWDSENAFKGLINLGTTPGSTMSDTLQALTDGEGTDLPIKVRTNEFNVPANASVDQALLIKQRVIWQSPDSHYWEETINNAGEKILTDLGTTPPF